MKKDFDRWNDKKERIDFGGHNKFYRPGEIWWCYLGLNIGREENGNETEFKRPVLILKAFSADTCLVAPLTTSRGESMYRLPIGLNDSKLIISQIRTIDTKRLIDRITILNKEEFQYIRKTIIEFL